MSFEDTISDHVQQQFEAFQLAEIDQGTEIAASCRIAASIVKQIRVVALNESFSKIDLDRKQALSDLDIARFLIPLLVKYADAALCMETDAKNEYGIKRVFHLLSAIACALSFKNHENILAIIDRITIFSEVVSERLRSHACALSGCLASHIIESLVRCENKQLPSHQKEHFRENLSVLESLLVPRLTDKSQSVRQRAIQAAGMFFRKFRSVSKVTIDNSRAENISSSKLLEGLLWSMWHDSSVANRVEAIQAVPIESAEILDHVIARIRDVKEKVRNAAIRALQDKVDPRRKEIMTEEHFRDIIRSGLTDRCESTKLATMTLICTKWTKAAKFCPVELMRLMGATMYEEECEKALLAVLKMAHDLNIVRSNPIFQELSDPEIRSLRLNMEKSTVKLTDLNVIFDEYQLFYTRVFCSSAINHSDLTFAQKEAIIAKTTPDIPSLCDLFQKHLARLIESIQEEDDECVDQECFVCLQLLQLTKVVGLQEEGSRRYFSRVMIDVLAVAETPDDLVEECVQALRATFEIEFDFFNTISLILAKLTSAARSDDENEDHGRILFIFSVVLESAPLTLSTHDLYEVMTKIILSAVTNPEKAIREVGIGCFGKLGLLSNKSTVLFEFKPILLKIAAEKDEAIQCRGQSLLALSDWALVFPDVLQPQIDSNSGENLSLLLIVGEMIQHRNTTLATIAAEVATKLLFSLQISDTSLLASLLVLFLDPNNCKEYDETSEPDIDIKEVGSPLRLQQLLSLFFPAFCLKSDEYRNKFVGSIENALLLAMEDIPKKKANCSKVFPLVSIADYVCSVVSGNGVMSNEVITGGNGTDANEQKLDLSLSACLQVAKFLVENVQKMNLTQTRSMCKFLGNQDIKLENEERMRLGKLKDLIEELSFLEESSCSKALRPLVDLLSNVKGYEDNYNDIEGDKEEPGFDTTYDDDDTISENTTEMTPSDTIGETTIEDIDMMSTIARLSLENKENPPAIVKTRRKSQRSSNQSNVSVLGSLGSPNI